MAMLGPRMDLTFRPLSDQIGASLTRERIVASASAYFAVLAVLLAGLGLFGMTSYTVGRRRREIGIRMALGATSGAVLRMVLGRVSLLIGAGLLIGVGASLWAARFIAPLLFGLESRDASTFAGATVLLAGIGILAAWRPARHAASVDPAGVLRSE